MDFGDLDISDLAPPALDGAVAPLEAEEEPAPVREQPALAAAGIPSPAGGSGPRTCSSTILTWRAPTGWPPPKPRPGWRTWYGRALALDTFQIDLGELFAENKK